MWLWECAACGLPGGPSTIAHLKRAASCAQCAHAGENSHRWKGHREISGKFLSQYRRDAATKNRVWDVAPEYLWGVWEDQDGRCAYTGWDLTHGVDASLDRIDSRDGYVVGNVQWVHRNINRMKSDFSEDEFIRMCEAVAHRGDL